MAKQSNVIDLAARRAAKKRKRVRCLTVLLDNGGSDHRYHTVECIKVDGKRTYNVYGWRERPDSAELKGPQNIVACFPTLEAARAAFPAANLITRGKRLVLRETWPEEYEDLCDHWTVGPVHRAPPKKDDE